NMLKLRTAYGEVGNEDVGGYYPWRATYENAQNAGEAGFIQSSLGNRDLKWEVSRSFDVAVEFALFNRLRGSIEFFNRYSDNLLFSVPLSYSTGHTNQDMNTGTMYNRGVEIELSGDILTTPDFTWDATVNATHYKNKVTKLPVDPYTSGVHKIEEGHSRYDFYLRQWRGVDPATGSSLYVVDPQYLESSESLVEVGGVTYTTDHQEALYDYCGNSIPKLSGGLTTNLKYRDFSLTMSFYFQVGGKMYDSGYAGLMSPGTSSLSYSTVHKDIMNRWQKPGDITDVPRISNGSDASSLYASSDRFLISSDMLELSNINFGYSIPKHINKVLGISSLRFYVSAENVFQITRRKGIYPRKTVGGYSSNMDVYLPARVFTVGMNLNF
ncbi:MAG: TonB-dependent receptor, partial [Muribaculaceae bacterium]|nr:TonB-dependent receptor [Muribaculaceae bacterium]